MTRLHALGLVCLVACGDDGPAPTLRFTPLDDGEISRVVRAALGLDAARAINELDLLASADAGCPVVTHDGDIATLTGGCTSPTGFLVMGRARRIIEPDARHYEFDDFVMGVSGRIPFSVAGTVDLTDKFPSEPLISPDEYRERAIELVVETSGLRVRSVLHFHCDRGEGCRTSDDLATNRIEVVGHGAASVVGRSSFDVDLTLRGFETVEVFMAPLLSATCLQWRLVGTDRSAAPLDCPR